MRKIALLTAVFVGFFAAGASAQVQEKTFELGGFGGMFVGNELYKATPTPVFEKYIADLDEFFHLGVRAGYNFSPKFGIEGSFGYSPNELTIEQDQALFDVQYEFDADIYTFDVILIYHIVPDKQAVPYVAVGVGAIMYKMDVGSVEARHTFQDPPQIIGGGHGDETAIGGIIALGYKVYINNRWILRGEVRDTIHGNEYDSVPGAYPAGTSFRAESTLHTVTANAGLSYVF